MNLLFKGVLISLYAISTFAKSVEKDEDVCTSTELLRKTHLACVSCALKKLGRPLPDNNYLAMMGLLVRENAALFVDEQNPNYKKPGRRDLKTNKSEIVDSGSGPVELTTRAQYQKSVIQMILAGGYCTQGKVKPKVKDNTYANVISRINSDKFAIDRKDKKEREKAINELGYSDWDLAKHEFYDDSKDKSFFGLSFEDQKTFYKNRRTSSLNKHYSNQYGDTYGTPENELADCLKDIDANYTPVYSSPQDSYVACHAIYDGCEIATTPQGDEANGAGEIYRKDSQGRDVRVGGDWCATKYQSGRTLAERKDPIKNNTVPQEKNVVRSDGTPLAPVVDKSFRSLGEVTMSADGKIVSGADGDIDMTKVEVIRASENNRGGIFIPFEAIKTKNPNAIIGNPVQANPPTPASQGGAIK